MSVAESQIRIYRDYGDSYSPNDMQFRLTYEGPLRPSGNNTSYGSHKHEIRRAFHPQLKALWETNPNLRQLGEASFNGDSRTILQYLAENNPLKEYNFVPLVSDALSLTCGIDVLFLRRGPVGHVLKAGDIDNRIHTLLDALQRPTQLQELGTDRPPTESEKPFFVLLENDRLVSRLTVETDTMLEPLVGGIPQDTDARLIVTVTVRPSSVTMVNVPLV